VLRSLCYHFLKALAASSFLTPFVRSVLQSREKCEGASAGRGVLRSKVPRRCTLVLGHCCVPAPRPLRMIGVAMRWTSGGRRLEFTQLTK
jgi:hypothetical protein